MANISFYGSHNAAFVVEDKGKILLVLEAERILNLKNIGIAQYLTAKPDDLIIIIQILSKYIQETLKIKKFKNCYYLNSDVLHYGNNALHTYFPAENYIESHHHESHAAGAFYQSPYKKALIFSFDGGGDDGKFNIYLADRKNSVSLQEIVTNPSMEGVWYDLGFPYMIFGQYLKDINLQSLMDGNLVYPGKLMGLASYGKVKKTWLKHFISFYKSDPNGINFEEKIKTLGEKIKVSFDVNNRLEGKVAYDIAATSQKAFEECFLEIAKPYMKKYPKHPICVAGGCGLNIILNTRLVKEFNKKVFVGPNPNDCGISLGMMLHQIKPSKPIDITYSGTKLLDLDLIPYYINNVETPFVSFNLNSSHVAKELAEGKIIGVARGRAEHGPRALGNRSILCNPSLPKMKDILNEKVKNREWYRPFAPVVRLEDVNKYFEWDRESRWMSFCPVVRKEWRKKLQSITHVDGTARVQTVTKEQNPWLYDLIGLFEKETGIGVLLNTSFNVAGKPILSTAKDAFKIFKDSEMDSLIIEEYHFKKGTRETLNQTTLQP